MLQQLLVCRHQSVGTATSNPVKFWISLRKLSKFTVKVGISRHFTLLYQRKINTGRVETDVVEHIWIVGSNHERVHTAH